MLVSFSFINNLNNSFILGMTSKDIGSFEVRKHNDFSVLCMSSDDEESKKDITETEIGSTAVSSASAVPPLHEEQESDGFETFTTVRKVKRTVHPKPFITSAPSTNSSGAPFVPSAATRLAPKPKEIIVPKAENSIELYDFPSTLKTADLRKFLQSFDGHYRLKWINDTSCYVVFDDESLGIKLLYLV